ncbi:Disease resistance protein (CC-NBS-LRR class) family [Rhynchospora pubera]|uniref:Disease resistance protein (CC-NBS-LRR class) family n=1 Tax=Rhynchospora pubera TaxID=906938 RepID=A0AAV8E9T3_9POAL|nr:Disease resistance protein (CC-NBS-LRR class) family [Rhynchospora pubera]
MPEPKPGKREAVKRWFMKTKKFRVFQRVGDEINQIMARIQEINESRITYGITNIGEGIEEEIRKPVRRIVLPDNDEAGIVGFEADRDKITSLLLDETTTRRSVVSIVGPGGLGKTTLARKVYNSEDVKKQFDVRMWVVISQKFDPIDILRKIAKQLGIQQPQGLSEHELAELYRSLTTKRYLLVLDDIWKNDLWTQIEGILPNSNNKSRVLITTRFFDVAKEADPLSTPYKLQFLTEELSLELFLKKALINRNANEECPPDLLDIGKKIVKRCDGLPLALIVLGGLLSKKQANYATWSRMMQTMDWGTDGEECLAIIGTSYEDLPLVLKSCFMYFAAFPEDHEIDAQSLIRIWIAEGFVPQIQNRTLEDTANSFLEDLVQRSMIQVSDRDVDGSILLCRIHDVLRDLAIQKAKDDNFLMVCSKSEDLQNCGQMRRLAIHDSSWDSKGKEGKESEELYNNIASASPNLRSLFSWKRMPKVAELMHLRVLCTMSRQTDIENLENFGRLSLLRYVWLNLCVESEKDKKTFQKFIGGMRFLQTVDLRSSYIICDLPDCLWHVKTLRHVLLNSVAQSFSGPLPSVDLPNLQTLSGVVARESWEAEGLPKIPNVKILNIRSSNESQWNNMSALLGTLEHLISLSISGDDIPLNIIDMRGFPFYHRLQSLALTSLNEQETSNTKKISLDHVMLPIHLTTLFLDGLQFQEDPTPVLRKLENLRHFIRYL